MRYFAMVVKTGGMSHAAAQLKLAQTAISIQIRDLEREIGVSLFERHSRGVVPTKAGEVLYERYNELERFLERTLDDVRSAAGSPAPRPFVIGLVPSHMRLVGADVLIAAGTKLPATSLKLVEELSFALIAALERKEIDLAFAYDVEGRPGLVREAVIEDELLFVTARANASDDSSISFADALKEELFFAGERGIVTLVRRMAQRLSLEPRIVSDMQSVPAIRARIAEGGASLLPYGSVADGVSRGIFAIRRIERPVPSRTLYMVSRREERSLLEDELIGPFLKDVVRHICRASAPYAIIVDPRFEILGTSS
ncbi:LysR family transcriptional regulator [Sinorhizobium mexicanum]|nr:LysR family transcriptional regulator [Sinorhizobium mexicanum]